MSVYSEKEGKGKKYGIKLDHRILRTPLRCPFLIPSEPLALAVAQEWSSQREMIQPSLMHLTALCNTVLDAGNQESGRHPQKEDVKSLIDYVETDTLW